jgi:hypothetical protein
VRTSYSTYNETWGSVSFESGVSTSQTGTTTSTVYSPSANATISEGVTSGSSKTESREVYTDYSHTKTFLSTAETSSNHSTFFESTSAGYTDFNYTSFADRVVWSSSTLEYSTLFSSSRDEYRTITEETVYASLSLTYSVSISDTYTFSYSDSGTFVSSSGTSETTNSSSNVWSSSTYRSTTTSLTTSYSASSSVYVQWWAYDVRTSTTSLLTTRSVVSGSMTTISGTPSATTYTTSQYTFITTTGLSSFYPTITVFDPVTYDNAVPVSVGTVFNRETSERMFTYSLDTSITDSTYLLSAFLQETDYTFITPTTVMTDNSTYTESGVSMGSDYTSYMSSYSVLSTLYMISIGTGSATVSDVNANTNPYFGASTGYYDTTVYYGPGAYLLTSQSAGGANSFSTKIVTATETHIYSNLNARIFPIATASYLGSSTSAITGWDQAGVVAFGTVHLAN